MFVKGKSGNPVGRPLGSLNKQNHFIAKQFLFMLEDNMDLFKADLLAVEPRDRLAIMLKLAEFILPKKRETKLSIDSLTAEEVDALVQKILNNE